MVWQSYHGDGNAFGILDPMFDSERVAERRRVQVQPDQRGQSNPARRRRRMTPATWWWPGRTRIHDGERLRDLRLPLQHPRSARRCRKTSRSTTFDHQRPAQRTVGRPATTAGSWWSWASENELRRRRGRDRRPPLQQLRRSPTSIPVNEFTQWNRPTRRSQWPPTAATSWPGRRVARRTILRDRFSRAASPERSATAQAPISDQHVRPLNSQEQAVARDRRRRSRSWWRGELAPPDGAYTGIFAGARRTRRRLRLRRRRPTAHAAHRRTAAAALAVRLRRPDTDDQCAGCRRAAVAWRTRSRPTSTTGEYHQ